MHIATRMLLGSMAVGGLAGFGHGVVSGAPMLIGATVPLWFPVMLVYIPLRICPHLNMNKHN
jgi:hypothetical protein